MWWAVALVFALRAIAAFTLPLTGDEAYYWEWSRRLAFGYVDHPPAVAWTIAAFAPLGHSPGIVRLGFILCGVVTSLALAACAIELSGDRRAGAVAALAMALTPLASLAFGIATPDGPYLMFWSLALWFGARAFARDELIFWLLLGLALGGVLLSRVLGVALIFGVIGGIMATLVNHAPLGPFFATFFNNAETTDLWGSLVKTTLFGAIIAIVCCYKGMTASGGAEGVGRAVNQAVVIAFLGVFAFNYAFTQTLLATHPEITTIVK